MKTSLSLLFFLIATANAPADSVQRAIMAAMKLTEEKSYSWHCSVVDDAQDYEIEGKTVGGYTWQRQPIPKHIAKRLGREAGYSLEAIFKNAYDFVIATENGWNVLGELPKQHADWRSDEWIYVSVPVWRSPDMSADESEPDPIGLPPAIYVPVVHNDDSDATRAYSNAQFALALPHEELAVIVSCHTEISVNSGVAVGRLNDIGAQLLLVHDGHEYIKPVLATGGFKLWLQDDGVAKYVIELAGILVVKSQPVYVRQRSTTILKDIGTTILKIPPEARQKLSR